jgi:hypothetical protein
MHVRFWQILLQKSPSRLREIDIFNDRIGARAPLNRCCAFAPDLESMSRDKMLKMFLQQYRHIPGVSPRVDVERGFTLGLALEQLRRNFNDLARRPGRVRATGECPAVERWRRAGSIEGPATARL